MTPLEALQKAVENCGGSPALFAQRIGGTVLRQHVEYWLKKGRVPSDYCPTIERNTRQAAAERADPELVVTCEQLRPDVAWSVLREHDAAPPSEPAVEFVTNAAAPQ